MTLKMHPMRSLLLISLASALAACTTAPTGESGRMDSAAATSGANDARLVESPECKAANLRAAEPMPASMLPAEVLARRVNGWVAMRYDVIKGKAENVEVVASQPKGVYEPFALQHAKRYREPTGATVRGCIMTVNLRY